MPVPPSTRYIVLKWSQPGSSKPELATSDIFTSLIDADDLARDEQAEAKRDGRSDSYTVHEVNMDVVQL